MELHQIFVFRFDSFDSAIDAILVSKIFLFQYFFIDIVQCLTLFMECSYKANRLGIALKLFE